MSKPQEARKSVQDELLRTEEAAAPQSAVFPVEQEQAANDVPLTPDSSGYEEPPLDDDQKTLTTIRFAVNAPIVRHMAYGLMLVLSVTILALCGALIVLLIQESSESGSTAAPSIGPSSQPSYVSDLRCTPLSDAWNVCLYDLNPHEEAASPGSQAEQCATCLGEAHVGSALRESCSSRSDGFCTEAVTGCDTICGPCRLLYPELLNCIDDLPYCVVCDGPMWANDQVADDSMTPPEVIPYTNECSDSQDAYIECLQEFPEDEQTACFDCVDAALLMEAPISCEGYTAEMCPKLRECSSLCQDHCLNLLDEWSDCTSNKYRDGCRPDCV